MGFLGRPRYPMLPAKMESVALDVQQVNELTSNSSNGSCCSYRTSLLISLVVLIDVPSTSAALSDEAWPCAAPSVMLSIVLSLYSSNLSTNDILTQLQWIWMS
jgi:hypothetical protein